MCLDNVLVTTGSDIASKCSMLSLNNDMRQAHRIISISLATYLEYFWIQNHYNIGHS